MADPITMGAMVGLQVLAKTQAAVAQDKAHRYNANIDEANAQASLADGAAAETATLARLRAVQGDAIVASGASGARVGTGSALEALRQNAVNAQFDVLGARRQAAQRSNAYLEDAVAQRRAGKNALIQGLLGAGASALSGASSIGQISGPSTTMSAMGPRLPAPSYHGSGSGMYSWNAP